MKDMILAERAGRDSSRGGEGYPRRDRATATFLQFLSLYRGRWQPLELEHLMVGACPRRLNLRDTRFTLADCKRRSARIT